MKCVRKRFCVYITFLEFQKLPYIKKYIVHKAFTINIQMVSKSRFKTVPKSRFKIVSQLRFIIVPQLRFKIAPTLDTF